MASAEKRGNGPTPWRVRWIQADGTRHPGKPGFASEKAAIAYGHDREAEIRARRYRDPKLGEITVDEYFARWLPAQDLEQRAVDSYDGHHRTHLSPAFGGTALCDLDPLDIATWEKGLRKRRSKSTADGVMRLFGMLMADAVFEGRIFSSPIQPRRRRGRRVAGTAREGVATTLEKVLAICARLPGPEALLVLVTACTGMRWGEAIGIRRSFLTLEPAKGGKAASGFYVIDPELGAVHEDKKGHRFIAHAKGHKGRTVQLPGFLVELLLAYLELIPDDRDLLFVDSENNPLRRSNFNRYRWRPACDGWPERAASRNHPGRRAADPVELGLHFHDLRHTHKTWLDEDGCRKVAVDERLGHAGDGMDAVYIHATPAMRARILAALERRWGKRRSFFTLAA